MKNANNGVLPFNQYITIVVRVKLGIKMLQKSHMIRRPIAIIWIMFCVLFFNAALYTIFTAVNFLFADEWRHFNKIIIPLVEGKASWSILFSNHHPYPLLHLFQLINLYLFDYRPEYQAFLGLASQALAGFLLILLFLRSSSDNLSELQRSIFGVGLVILIFGFNSGIVYSWSAIGISQVFFLLSIILYLIVDTALRNESKMLSSVAVIFCFVLILANGDSGTIFIGVIPLVIFVIRGFRNRKYVKLALLSLIPIFIYWIFLQFINVPNSLEGAQFPSTLITGKSAYLFDLILGYSVGLASGLINFDVIIKKYAWSAELLIGLSVLLVILQVVITVLYIKEKKYYISIVPVILTAVGLIFFLSLALYRYNPGDNIWIFASPRYGSIWRLPVIGFILSLALLWPVMNQWKRCTRLSIKTIFLTTATILLVLISAQTLILWNGSAFRKELNNQLSFSLFLASLREEGSLELPRAIAGHNRKLDRVYDFLQKRQLNVFSDNHRKNSYFSNYLKSRQIYFKSHPELTFLDESICDDAILIQGPLSVKLKERKMTINNIGEDIFVIRIVIEADNYIRQGLIVSDHMSNGDPKKQPVNLLKGKQAHYFAIESGQSIRLLIDKEAHYCYVSARLASDFNNGAQSFLGNLKLALFNCTPLN
jgi:hypothetical protein